MHTFRSIALATGALLMLSAGASAQPSSSGTVFLNVNAGGQLQSHTVTTTSTFPIYGQTASVSTAQAVETGPFFDLSVGAKVWQDLAIAVGFADYRNANDVVGNARIPHPVFFDREQVVEFSAGAEHHERNVSLLAVWFVPVTDDIDIAVSAGPSFTRVRQGVVAELSVPPGSQDAIPIVEMVEEWAKGASVGVDATYLLTPRYNLFGSTGVRIGLGVFFRYNSGSITLPSGEELGVGGTQAGGGIRLRF